MEQQWQRVIGPVQDIPPASMEHYLAGPMALFVVKDPVNFADMEHNHQGYEFVVSFGPDAPFLVDGNSLTTERQRLFPFNAGQSHQAEEDSQAGLVALMFRRRFLRDIASSMFGATEPLFRNVSIDYGDGLRRILRAFAAEVAARQPGYELAADSLALQACLHLLRSAPSNCAGLPAAARRPGSRPAVVQARDYLQANFQRHISLTELADAVHMSPYHLSRCFKRETGMSPFAYLSMVKIERAKQLLRHKNRTITEVCLECGFNNLSHFSRAFSQRVGVSPSAYRRQSR